MGQLETLQEINERLSFIKNQTCLERTYCTVSSASLTLDSGELNADFVPIITLLGDSNTAIDDFVSQSEAVLLAQYGLYITWLSNYLAVFKPPATSDRQFLTRKFGGAYQSSFIRRIFSQTQVKLSEVSQAHSLNLIDRYNSLAISTGGIPFKLISTIAIPLSGLYEIPLDAKRIVINIEPPIEGLYSSRISQTSARKYSFGGISFYYDNESLLDDIGYLLDDIGYLTDEISIQWKRQIIDIPLDNPIKFEIYLRLDLEATCTFYG